MSMWGYVYVSVCILSMEDRRGCQIFQDSYRDCEPSNKGNGI